MIQETPHGQKEGELNHLRMGATISALWCGIAGAVLLFAPREVGPVLLPGAHPPVLMQLLGGALVLLSHGREGAASYPALWLFTGMYVVGAAFFTYLMFFSSGLKGR